MPLCCLQRASSSRGKSVSGQSHTSQTCNVDNRSRQAAYEQRVQAGRARARPGISRLRVLSSLGLGKEPAHAANRATLSILYTSDN